MTIQYKISHNIIKDGETIQNHWVAVKQFHNESFVLDKPINHVLKSIYKLIDNNLDNNDMFFEHKDDENVGYIHRTRLELEEALNKNKMIPVTLNEEERLPYNLFKLVKKYIQEQQDVFSTFNPNYWNLILDEDKLGIVLSCLVPIAGETKPGFQDKENITVRIVVS